MVGVAYDWKDFPKKGKDIVIASDNTVITIDYNDSNLKLYDPIGLLVLNDVSGKKLKRVELDGKAIIILADDGFLYKVLPQEDETSDDGNQDSGEGDSTDSSDQNQGDGLGN